MKKRMLRDIEVSEVGMGCMAFSHGYERIPEEKYSIEAIRKHLEGSPDRLQTDYVDVYYLHRMSGVPVEELCLSFSSGAVGHLLDPACYSTITKDNNTAKKKNSE